MSYEQRNLYNLIICFDLVPVVSEFQNQGSILCVAKSSLLLSEGRNLFL